MSTGQLSSRSDSVERLFLLLWVLVTVWLLACAFLVGGEYGDGYQTIANARYFFGDNDAIYAQRGPLAALVLLPAELATSTLNLHALDVRPYHFYSAVLHSAYLLVCWLLLKRAGGSVVARVVAFATAILSVVFYANAPYLSHDIIPGLLFLVLIFACDRWLREPKLAFALLLVGLGAAVVLIKQTYAIFWVSICAYALLAHSLKWREGQVSLARMLALFGMAALSGIVSWLGYAWFLGAEIPSISFLERPLRLISTVALQYESGTDLNQLFPWDLYIRNLHAVGLTTIGLLIPGLIIIFRGSNERLKLIGVCLVCCIVLLQLTSFREVRYLAFLAPLAAIIVVPVIDKLVHSRAWLLPLLILFAFDQFRALSMAATQLNSASVMNVERIVGDAAPGGKLVTSNHLSFVFQAQSPMRRDRYHGMFHLTADIIERVHEGDLDVVRIDDAREFSEAQIEVGDRVLFSNRTMVRQPPWQADNSPYKLEEFIQTAGTAVNVRLVRNQDRFIIGGLDGRFIMLLPAVGAQPSVPLIVSGAVNIADLERIRGEIPGDEIDAIAVVIDTLCQADQCSLLD